MRQFIFAGRKFMEKHFCRKLDHPVRLVNNAKRDYSLANPFWRCRICNREESESRRMEGIYWCVTCAAEEMKMMKIDRLEQDRKLKLYDILCAKGLLAAWSKPGPARTVAELEYGREYVIQALKASEHLLVHGHEGLVMSRARLSDEEIESACDYVS